MKLLSIVVCFGSCDLEGVEEGRSLVVQPPEERRGRKRWRSVTIRGGGNVTNVADWRPSLSSISEDDIPGIDLAKQTRKEAYPKESQMIKRKVESSPKPRTHHYNHHYHDHVRRPSFSAMFPSLAPTPFLF